MGQRSVVILGVNGHIGQAVARAFVATGWDVAGMARRYGHPVPGVRYLRGDSDSVEDMRRAIGDAEVVVNALNLPYHQWDRGRMEAQMARVVEALGTAGRTVLFPGNIYNFAATDRLVLPAGAQHPQTPRGAIRVRVERLFEAAATRGDIQAIIVRAGDFYGPDSRNDWFDLAMFREIGGKRVAAMGQPGIGHAWAYLPDLARAFESLAALRATLRSFERFHFAGHFVTPEQMAAAIVKAAPEPLAVSSFPLWIMRLMGLWNPVMRETGKMSYLWTNPMQLADDRLPALLGPGFDTPFDTAVAATVGRFFAPPAQLHVMPELSGEARV